MVYMITRSKPINRSQREIDEAKVRSLDREANGLVGAWLVLRRGRPSSDFRIVIATMNARKAEDAFMVATQRMRQGSAVLVSSDNLIVGYASEPMVRTRW
jgi:hypothetical protein